MRGLHQGSPLAFLGGTLQHRSSYPFRSPEFAEPSERLHIFSQLRDQQQVELNGLVSHVQQVRGKKAAKISA